MKSEDNPGRVDPVESMRLFDELECLPGCDWGTRNRAAHITADGAVQIALHVTTSDGRKVKCSAELQPTDPRRVYRYMWYRLALATMRRPPDLQGPEFKITFGTVVVRA